VAHEGGEKDRTVILKSLTSGLLFDNFVITRVEFSKHGPDQIFSVHVRHEHERSIGTPSGFREINVHILNSAKHNIGNLGFDHSYLPEKSPAPLNLDSILERIGAASTSRRMYRFASSGDMGA
jgi:hypothetical protein